MNWPYSWYHAFTLSDSVVLLTYSQTCYFLGMILQLSMPNLSLFEPKWITNYRVYQLNMNKSTKITVAQKIYRHSSFNTVLLYSGILSNTVFSRLKTALFIHLTRYFPWAKKFFLPIVSKRSKLEYGLTNLYYSE